MEESLVSSALAPADSNVVNTHLAEYQALTNRNTYNIYIQSTFWPMLIAVLALMTLTIDKIHAVIIAWSASLVVGIVCALFAAFHCDEMTTTMYLERTLRPRVQALVRNSDCWSYESWLAATRGNGPFWWEFLPLALPWLAILCAAVGRMNFWSNGDWLGISFSILLGVVSVVVGTRAVRLRRAILGRNE